MKTRINKILFLLAAVVMLASCEADYIMFDSSKSFIAFTAKTTKMAEQGGMVGIPVLVTATSGSPAVSVSFDFSSADFGDLGAVEGTDFTLVNDSKTLTFSQGWGYDTIWIQPIDNDIFTGDKKFMTILKSNTLDYPFGAVDTITATILDNEHPLKDWIGTYTVEAADYWSYFGPETWTVTTAPDPDDVNNLRVTGIGDSFSSYYTIVAKVDMDAMTITFTAGSEIGVHSAYGGPLAIFLGDADGNLYEEPIVGEIHADGSMYVDLLGIKFVGGINAGLSWGAYETVWTPAK